MFTTAPALTSQIDSTPQPTPNDQTPRLTTPMPFHVQLGENVTWVNDWYSFDNANLKGWVKTNVNHKSGVKLEPTDIIDLSKWKYH